MYDEESFFPHHTDIHALTVVVIPHKTTTDIPYHSPHPRPRTRPVLTMATKPPNMSKNYIAHLCIDNLVSLPL